MLNHVNLAQEACIQTRPQAWLDIGSTTVSIICFMLFYIVGKKNQPLLDPLGVPGASKDKWSFGANVFEGPRNHEILAV